MVIESKRKKKKEENNNSGNNGLTSLLKCSCYAKINRCRDFVDISIFPQVMKELLLDISFLQNKSHF